MNNNFLNEDVIKTKLSYPNLFRRMWPYAKKEKFLLSLAIVAVLGGALVSRLIPSLIGYAIDHGIRGKNFEIFTKIAFAYLGLEILKSFLSFANVYFFQRFGNRMLFHLREDLLSHAQNLPLQFFNKTPTGRIVTRLTNDVAALGDLFTDGVISVFTQFIVICSVVLALGFISWKLTFVALICSPIFIFASLKLSDHIRIVLHDQKKKLSTLNSFLAENLNGMKVVQLYNRTRKNKKKFVELTNEYRDLNIKSIQTNALMQPITNLFNAVTITASLYYGGILRLEEGIAIGSLVAFLINIQDFMPPLREILDKYQQFQNSLTSAERIFTLMDEPVETDVDSPINYSQLHGQIEIRNLNFRYELHLPWVLKNINLNFKSGESIALIGRTGSGKSTFISLLQRFYDAPENTIFIDGIPLHKTSRSKIRRHIGVVQQDNFIFKGTIKDNISLGDPSISDDQVLMACEKVGYFNLLSRTNRNLASPVEERGANLSVGERQLIAFARILAFNPDILILDEATANIDSENEIIIQSATKEITKGRTSIIIAHRLSTIEQCDRIVVLDQGQVAEEGKHEQLMESKGLYFQFASAGLKSTLMEASAAGTDEP